MVGIGWIWFFTSSSNFFGIYLSDLITPNNWIGFQSFEGLGAEIFVKSFFTDLMLGNYSFSIYGLLFTIGIIAGIIRLILLFGNKKAGSALLIGSGILGLVALLLFYQFLSSSFSLVYPGNPSAISFNKLLSSHSHFPIPIDSILLLIAGLFAYSENK
jgi:hypothetical protein